MTTREIETMQITEVPCNPNDYPTYCVTYCEGMVTEDNKNKKKTQDIIAG